MQKAMPALPRKMKSNVLDRYPPFGGLMRVGFFRFQLIIKELRKTMPKTRLGRSNGIFPNNI